MAAQFGVSRDEQDSFAARSHALAAAAQAAGRFRDEIVPVQTVLKDPKTGERTGSRAAKQTQEPSLVLRGARAAWVWPRPQQGQGCMRRKHRSAERA